MDHFWNKVLDSKGPSGVPAFSLLGKTVKCALILSHGNADNERSLSQNKKTLTKERTGLSTMTLNGLRATADGIQSNGGLSKTSVTTTMLSAVKGSHKAYQDHIRQERKKQEEKKKGDSADTTSEKRKRKEKEQKKLEELKSTSKDLDAREKRAEELLQKSSAFLKEGKECMEKGVSNKDMDEIEAAQKILQLAEEKQHKAQEELQSVHKEKRKLADKLEEKAFKKYKTQ